MFISIIFFLRSHYSIYTVQRITYIGFIDKIIKAKTKKREKKIMGYSGYSHQKIKDFTKKEKLQRTINEIKRGQKLKDKITKNKNASDIICAYEGKDIIVKRP